jgi:hypothetical protein
VPVGPGDTVVAAKGDGRAGPPPNLDVLSFCRGNRFYYRHGWEGRSVTCC